MMSRPDMFNMKGMMNYCPMMYGYGMGMCPCMQSNMMPGMMHENMPMSGTMPGMMCPYEMKRIDESDDLEFEDDDDETRAPQKVDEILKKIEVSNPMIFRRLAAYGVPAFAARRIVRRIIYLTLIYER